MTSVVSSNIRAVGYLEDARELWVDFRRGTTYVYYSVSVVTYRQLMASSSKGQYLADVIKDRYTYRHVA